MRHDTIGIIGENLAWIFDYGISLQKKGKKIIVGYKCQYQNHDITLYVKNKNGFSNLCQIYANGFDKKYSADLICTIQSHNENIVFNLKQIFKKDFYMMVDRSTKDEILLADKLNVFIVANHTICHIDEKDYTAYKALRAIDTTKYLVEIQNEDCSYLSDENMAHKYRDLPDALHNTLSLAKKCDFTIESRELKLPNFKSENTIFEIAEKGLKKKGLYENKIYHNRLYRELKVINEMGFDGYFLIVSDFVKYARQNNIPVGPGRGSGAGSLVAWCLEITDIDPIERGLFFERFLNPERVSMPDFDIDFCPLGREKIVEYMKKKYGKNNVAYISTFGTLKTKAAIRDVARILSLPFPMISELCDMIPFIPVKPLTLRDALELNNVQDMIENDQSLNELFDIALQIEGLQRHESIHAAGVVISHGSLLNQVPTKIDNGQLVVSCEVNNIETAGLVKFDLLGLKNLTIIHEVCEIVKIKIENISLNDKKTFDLLSSGDTYGIFQLEGKAMKDILVKLNVSKLEEIIAVISLYRPGPMGSIPEFIENKHNPKKISYEYEDMKEILNQTFGIIVYQEQVLQIAQKMAGYSAGEADLLRRAMGKKKPEEMSIQKEKFVNGIIKNSSDSNKEKAEKLFDNISKFAGYAFCKAHAAPYGLISYRTAYLKTHFLYEFTQVMLNLNINNISEIGDIIYNSKCRILPPDINKSDGYFKIEIINEKKFIRYGLYAIKNIGNQSLNYLICIQNRNFKTINDLKFLKLNKAQWKFLIMSGALDNFKENRAEMLEHDHNSQPTLFSIKKEYKDFSYEQKIIQEKESLGCIISNTHSFRLYELTGYKLGICLNSEKYRRGMYKITVSHNRQREYIFNKSDYSGFVVYKQNFIRSFSQFIKTISSITFYIANENDLYDLGKFKSGKTEVYLQINEKKFRVGLCELNIIQIRNKNILNICVI